MKKIVSLNDKRSVACVLLFSLLFLSSCNNETDTNKHYNSQYFDTIIDSYNYQTVVGKNNQTGLNSESQEFISLHSIGSFDRDGDYIFGEIKSVRIFNESVFVLDSRSNHLKVYSLEDGSHLRTVELQGRGPGELLYPADMIFDETEKHLYLLDTQGKFLQYSLGDYGSIELNQERYIGHLPLNMCMTLNGFAFRIRLYEDDQNKGITGNIVLWDDFTNPSEKIVGKVFESDNWLLTNQLSRGVISCNKKDGDIYSVDRYIPKISIYRAPDYEITDHILFDDLNLIRIIPTVAEGRLPEISYDRTNGGDVVHNIVTTEKNIFIQLYELHRNGEETFTTYQVDKEDLTLKNVYDDLGYLHQFTDSLMVTSVNLPYPEVKIYRKGNF